MGGIGLEQVPFSLSKTTIPQTGGAKSGALNDKIDKDLDEIIAAWPGLSMGEHEKMIALARKFMSRRKAKD
jgi:hypothetical protein